MGQRAILIFHSNLIDSNYADATIKCQGREIRACASILASRCKFFEACFRDDNFKVFVLYMYSSRRKLMGNSGGTFEDRYHE